MESTAILPPILFHYCPPERRVLDNLRDQFLYFGAPRNFNDPYDCDIVLSVSNMTEEEYHTNVANKFGVSNPVPFQEFVANTNKLLEEFVIARRNLSGVLCLCEENHNVLMWSQYADRGRGVCLGFDPYHQNASDKREGVVRFSGKAFTKVTYTTEILDNDAYKVLVDGTNRPYMDLFSRKAKNWEHEKEWRMFALKEGKLKYEAEALKRVDLGTEVSKYTKDFVRAVVQEIYPKTELWQGRRSKKEYKVEFDPINAAARAAHAAR